MASGHMYKSFFIQAHQTSHSRLTNTETNVTRLYQKNNKKVIVVSCTENKNSKTVFTETLTLLHLNVQCITNKIGLLDLLNADKKPTLLALTEHWLNNSQLDIINLEGYTLLSHYSRSTYLHGGSAIFIRNDHLTKGKALKCLCKMSIEATVECAAVSLNNTCVVSIYRPPNGDVNIFFNTRDQIIKRALTLNQ